MPRAEAFFMSMEGGGRFCLLHHPEPGSVVGAMLFVHPFAEEMNKSRRMAALQARALAARGWIVLQIDLHGCGDSAGDFGEATWKRWVSDVTEAAGWLRVKMGHAPVLWALRAGCLIAGEAAQSIAPPPDLLFWNPVTSGKQALQQFLRVEVASQMLGSPGAERTGTQRLREALARGATIEVAGYALSPELALGLDAAELRVPGTACRVVWLEISRAGALSPAARMRVQAWESAGQRVNAQSVDGPAFWQTQEISECPALIEATLNAASWFRSCENGL